MIPIETPYIGLTLTSIYIYQIRDTLHASPQLQIPQSYHMLILAGTVQSLPYPNPIEFHEPTSGRLNANSGAEKSRSDKADIKIKGIAEVVNCELSPKKRKHDSVLSISSGNSDRSYLVKN